MLLEPRHVAMLVQGSEVYGIGTIERLYTSHWPEMTVVCLERGPMYAWLRERKAQVELVEGLAHTSAAQTARTLVKLPLVMRQARRDARRIHERLAGRDVRVIHTHWLPQQLIAGCMRRFGYLSVWQINNNMSRRRAGGLGVKLNHALARWGADLLLPASDFIAANWAGCGVPARTVRNAAVPLYDGPSRPPLDGPVRCLVAGRMHRSKGHHVAVEAVVRAREAGCDVRLDLFGGPLEGNAYADELRAILRRCASEDAVRFMGFASDLRQRHREYHLGLQCRLDPEPCSLWICETLVDGLPLLASATGGTPELVEEGVTGYLYPAGSADELCRHLVELCRDRPRLDRMRQAAFDRGRRLFTVDRFLRQTLDAYVSIAGVVPSLT